MKLQLFLRHARVICHLSLVVFEGHNNVGNEDYVCHQSRQSTRVCCVACMKLATTRHKPASKDSPLKTRLTVKKYVPIGSVIIAKVKLINFQMTELCIL
jgi:hypothetical protein